MEHDYKRNIKFAWGLKTGNFRVSLHMLLPHCEVCTRIITPIRHRQQYAVFLCNSYDYAKNMLYCITLYYCIRLSYIL